MTTTAFKGNPKRDEDDEDSFDEEVDSDSDSESDSSHFSDTEIREMTIPRLIIKQLFCMCDYALSTFHFLVK